MKTTYTPYPLTAEPTHHEIDWPEDPGYDRIKRLVEPLINGEPLEHVTVLHDGRRHDMFVSEIEHMLVHIAAAEGLAGGRLRLVK